MADRFLEMSDFSNTAKAIYLFTPMQYGINTLASNAHKANHHKLGKAINVAEYFVTPFDRMIQFFAIPVFSVMTDVYVQHQKKNALTPKLVIGCGCASLINIFTRALALSIAISFNTAFNLLTGYKIIKALDDPKAPENFFTTRDLIRRGTDQAAYNAYFMTDKHQAHPKIPNQSGKTQGNGKTLFKSAKVFNSPLVQKNLEDYKEKIREMHLQIKPLTKKVVDPITNKETIKPVTQSVFDLTTNETKIEAVTEDTLTTEISKLISHATELKGVTLTLNQSGVQIFGYGHIDDIMSKHDLEQRRKPLALIYHPDRNKNPEQQELGKEINKVYDIILKYKNW